MIKNNVILEFGTGDINLISAISVVDGVGMVGFRNQEPREIGTVGDSTEFIEMTELPILMAFNKIESIDVVIDSLKEVKELMLEIETK